MNDLIWLFINIVLLPNNFVKAFDKIVISNTILSIIFNSLIFVILNYPNFHQVIIYYSLDYSLIPSMIVLKEDIITNTIMKHKVTSFAKSESIMDNFNLTSNPWHLIILINFNLCIVNISFSLILLT